MAYVFAGINLRGLVRLTHRSSSRIKCCKMYAVKVTSLGPLLLSICRSASSFIYYGTTIVAVISLDASVLLTYPPASPIKCYGGYVVTVLSLNVAVLFTHRRASNIQRSEVYAVADISLVAPLLLICLPLTNVSEFMQSKVLP